MDEPIFFLCLPFPSSSNETSMFWYVIEDGRNLIHDQIKGEDDGSDEGYIKTVLVSDNNTDLLRPLRLPNLSLQIIHTELVVINSRINMFNTSYNIYTEMNHPNRDIFKFCDTLNLTKSWQFGPSFPFPAPFFTDVSTSNNGSIIVLGSDLSFKKCVLWLESSTSSSWKVLPKPSKELLVSFSTARLLAVTDTHIFCTVRSKIEPFNYGLRFSFVNKEWEVFDKRSFCGAWSKGVVLDGSYLVLYGTPTYDPHAMEEEAFLRVYDLDECKWVLMGSDVSSMYENIFPPLVREIFLDSSILFQVAHNKFALVWKGTTFGPINPHTQDPETHFEIYCTKFILHKTSGTDAPHTRGKKKRKITGTKPLSFSFEVFSHGTYRVCGPVINCAVRLTVGDEGTS